MSTGRKRKTNATRFLDAWLAARQLIQAANFNRFQRAGLSATQFMTLNLIPTNAGGMTLTELARALNLAPATVAKTIDSLEARGLVTRTRSDRDRRQMLLLLTAAGSELQNSASTEFHQHMTQLFLRMSATQRQGLIVGLEALVAAATPDADPAGSRSIARSPRLKS